MTQCRDWLTTLWPASYRGFHFYFESDDERGGRGLVIHEFPNRDAPFVEDLGEAPRFYEGTAYVHGDDVDGLASRFIGALSARGPATLVTPIGGPVLVHAQEFSRSHERDKLGYAAFKVKFVRDGAASAIVSLPLLSHVAFAAAQVAALSIARNFAGNIVMGPEVADHVAAAAIDGVEVASIAIDNARESNPSDPDVGSRLRNLAFRVLDIAQPILTGDQDAVSLAAGLADLAGIDPDPNPVITLALGVIEQARQLADAMPADTAQRVMRQLTDAFPPVVRGAPYVSPSLRRQAGNADAAARLVRLAALVAYSETIIRRIYSDRRAGVQARAELAARFEAELLQTTGAGHADLYRDMVALQGAVIDYLSRAINDLAPVITIEASRIMPSLFWAWRLYADPRRGVEIVARNATRHPSFVPATFAAVSR